jgi:hypothetical protein
VIDGSQIAAKLMKKTKQKKMQRNRAPTTWWFSIEKWIC